MNIQDGEKLLYLSNGLTGLHKICYNDAESVLLPLQPLKKWNFKNP